MNMNDDIFDLDDEPTVLDLSGPRTSQALSRLIPTLDERVAT